ncbi:MAG TPA: phosphoribosylaminoimidazolesuccinocarboxamide synthase [Patescibacteria group bacterium]|nr:phosphoribosylaminoimidazolesuccinocarboxamide synthase [Patescibacteria group bacterium]
MKLVIDGKTKSVYERPDGNLEFYFKDDATGYIGQNTGKPVFDSGYDKVVGQIKGKGRVSCQFSSYLFKLLNKRGVPTHYIETTGENVMVVKPAALLGMKSESDVEGAQDLYNLEWVFRNQAYGSFWRRYPSVKPGRSIDKLVEVYSKGLPGDSDILMVDDTLVELGIMTHEEVDHTKKMLCEIADLLYEECAKRGLHLIDGKCEFGRNKDGEIFLIDDISPDVIRVCRGAKLDENGNCTVADECIMTRIEENGSKKIIAKNLITADELAAAFEIK